MYLITTDEGVSADEQNHEGGNANEERREVAQHAQRQAAEAEQNDGVVEGPRSLGQVKLAKKPRACSAKYSLVTR